MTPPHGISPRPQISPHRLSLDIGPTWLRPASEGPSLSGLSLEGRLGESFRLSERWNWAFNGVFSYSNYFAEHGSLNRIGIGMETGPELELVPHMLGLALYGVFQEAFYYSKEVSWPGPTGRASFDNNSTPSFGLRPGLLLFGGALSTYFEYDHDLGIEGPGATLYDAPIGYHPNRYALSLSVDVLKAFYSAQGGYHGQMASLEEFILGIRPLAFIEANYNYSFNDPSGLDGAAPSNPYRPNMPFHHRPRLNLMELSLERPSTARSPFGLRVDGYFGQDPISFAPQSSVIEPVIGSRGDPDTQYFALHQAYLTYRFPVLEGLTLQAGQFLTTVGNEVPEGPLNTFLIPSRGFLNAFEPTHHAGLLLRSRFTEKSNEAGEVQNYTEGVLGVVNGWDSILGHEGGPTVMTGFNHQVRPDLSYALNYLIGAQGQGAQGLFNANVLYKPSEQWALGSNFDLGHGNNPDNGNSTLWFGLGLYQQYAPSSWFNVSLRQEVFSDPQGARSGLRQNLLSLTGATKISLPHGFGITPELRYDRSFDRDEGVPGPFLSGSNASESNTTFALRAFWKYP